MARLFVDVESTSAGKYEPNRLPNESAVVPLAVCWLREGISGRRQRVIHLLERRYACSARALAGRRGRLPTTFIYIEADVLVTPQALAEWRQDTLRFIRVGADAAGFSSGLECVPHRGLSRRRGFWDTRPAC